MNTPELSTASAGEAIAWLHESDPARCITNLQKASALRDGGASASSVTPYNIALYASPAPGRAPLTDEQIAVLQFLYGLGNLDGCGCGFGDRPHGERGMYWWRKHLRAAFPGIAPAGGIGGEL